MKVITSDLRDGVLHVTIDTPACPVNIFTHAAALELLGVIEQIDERAKALVLRSKKPHSFVNGASLMLGTAIRAPEDLRDATAPILRCYQAIADLPFPTVAAVRGSCYGCGVELALRCKYRVAGDSYDAHFYMTEMSDYLLVPTFGSTQYLPRLLGLEAATDFLLWGRKWSAQEALEHGLVNGVLRDEEFDAAVDRLAADLARTGGSASIRTHDGPRSQGDAQEFGNRTRARIQLLPPAYRDVYSTCYELIERAASKSVLEATDFAAEVAASGRSMMTTISKASVAFFFVRQNSEQVSARGALERESIRVECDMTAPGPRFLRHELENRRIRGVAFDDLSAEGRPDAWRVFGYPQTEGSPHSLSFQDRLELGPPDANVGVIAYAPGWAHGLPLVEIACSVASRRGGDAFRLFSRGGIPAAVTRPRHGFVINHLLRSFLKHQVTWLVEGRPAADLAATLTDFGFVRLPGDWLAGWNTRALATLVAADGASTSALITVAQAIEALPGARHALGGTPSDALRSAILISLLAAALRAVDDGSVAHPSILDVLARELIDFPLGHTSLCRYSTSARARELLTRHVGATPWVSEEDHEAVEGYVRGRFDFYR